jgi:hypothetical protein
MSRGTGSTTARRTGESALTTAEGGQAVAGTPMPPSAGRLAAHRTGRTTTGAGPMATHRTGRATAGLTAVLVISACASTPDPAPDDLAGCYYFEPGEAAQSLRLPWGVRLLADTVDGWPALEQRAGVRQAMTLVAPGEEAGHPFGYWLPLDGDSVEIGYPAGGGLLLTLAVGPTHLAGTVTPVGDALPPGAADPRPRSEPVSLLRARCP